MGYYTYYKLQYTLPNGSPLPFEVHSKIGEYIATNSYLHCAINSGEECKWYSYEKDMIAMSEEFTTALFVLDGEGEEAGDIWRAFYLNGQHYEWRAKIRPPEFDARKLK